LRTKFPSTPFEDYLLLKLTIYLSAGAYRYAQ
jgi:hypothetical protein